MVTQAKESKPKEEIQRITSSKDVKKVAKDVKPIQQFFSKFNNDWVMNFASGLAFNVLTAIFPILIALIAIFGLIVGNLAPGSEKQLIDGIQNAFPKQIQAGNLLVPVFNSLNRNAGPLLIIAILTALFGGSRLFVALEGYFDIIFHTRPRNVIRQNIMAFVMLLLFIVLIPLIIFGSALPALVVSLLKTTPLNNVPGSGIFFTAIGIVFAILFAWILFETIYVVVPNQKISFRNSWLGALVAAVLVEIYLILFPFYVTHFMNTYTGTAGFAVILLFFLYYFSVILLLGAEVNAFIAEKVRATPADIPTMIHELTSHLQTNEQAIQQQAAVSHKDEQPKAILPKGEASKLKQQAQKTGSNGKTAASSDGQMQTPSETEHKENNKKKGKGRTPGASNRFTILEVVAGTALAFMIELFRERKGK
ncbi:MAG TPA: YihY/virulence factor BrkB family protein [Ktedonobacteraceae bacterium]|nr:YihY/virulence factor BrkB family protein [Ktedonobacteraceae bacterium]